MRLAMSFFGSLFAELGARRRRLRLAMGDRGQSLFEFALLGVLTLGSAGLFVRSWMPAAAPWGFALPIVFIVGYIALDLRRQRAAAPAADAEHPHRAADRLALIWTLLCMAAAIATFVYAWSAEPPLPPPIDQGWQPPQDTLNFDIAP